MNSPPDLFNNMSGDAQNAEVAPQTQNDQMLDMFVENTDAKKDEN